MIKNILVLIFLLSSCTSRDEVLFNDLMDGVKSTTDKIIEDEIGALDAQGNLVNKPKLDIVKKKF